MTMRRLPGLPTRSALAVCLGLTLCLASSLWTPAWSQAKLSPAPNTHEAQELLGQAVKAAQTDIEAALRLKDPKERAARLAALFREAYSRAGFDLDQTLALMTGELAQDPAAAPEHGGDVVLSHLRRLTVNGKAIEELRGVVSEEALAGIKGLEEAKTLARRAKELEAARRSAESLETRRREFAAEAQGDYGLLKDDALYVLRIESAGGDTQNVVLARFKTRPDETGKAIPQGQPLGRLKASGIRPVAFIDAKSKTPVLALSAELRPFEGGEGGEVCRLSATVWSDIQSGEFRVEAHLASCGEEFPPGGLTFVRK